jgi:hypothetical protein
VTVDIEARNLALAGAIRMDWSVYRDDGTTLQVRGSGTTLENVIDDGSCDVLGSAGPVPCRSELRTQVSFSEEGQHLVSVTSDNAWGRRSRETHVAVNIDKTPPTVDFGDADPPPNAAGWHLGEVRVPYGVYDALSGVDGPGNGVVTVNSEAPVRLTVSDFASNSRTYDVPVRLDLTPPTTRCEVIPSVIWPPNGRLVPVTVAVGVDDALSGPAGFVLTSVTSSEPGAADDIQGFVPGTPSTSGWLRARRLGNGSGRVFTFTYTGIDVAGNTSNCVAEVTIRHDSGR